MPHRFCISTQNTGALNICDTSQELRRQNQLSARIRSLPECVAKSLNLLEVLQADLQAPKKAIDEKYGSRKEYQENWRFGPPPTEWLGLTEGAGQREYQEAEWREENQEFGTNAR